MTITSTPSLSLRKTALSRRLQQSSAISTIEKDYPVSFLNRKMRQAPRDARPARSGRLARCKVQANPRGALRARPTTARPFGTRPAQSRPRPLCLQSARGAPGVRLGPRPSAFHSLASAPAFRAAARQGAASLACPLRAVSLRRFCAA